MFHCGFYPDGDIYEQHKNFFIVAEDMRQADKDLHNLLYDKEEKYHVDGVQHIDMVEGYKISLEQVPRDHEHYGWTIIDKKVMR